ncbi:MAG: sulfate adenylyltransferase subunit CysN [Solirubrobacteraceae bacterium]
MTDLNAGRGRDEIAELIAEHQTRSLLRFLMCGSVDDGKSTLIGRLLYECHAVYADQLRALAADSRRMGTQGEALDFALLMDGLAAEREQGITIDVAYRYFSTSRRQFIVADAPGHEQYTRNMVTGASTADCAVILADARKGVLTQTRRHSCIVALLGIRHVVLAVNKMDQIGWSLERYNEIAEDYRRFAARVGLITVTCIPVSALRGDNVLYRSEMMPWYGGTTLMEYLEQVEVDQDRMRAESLRLPVQWVNRASSDFRGYAGTVVSGTVRPGDRIAALPSARESTVARIITMNGDLDVAGAGQAVTLTLEDEIDISRGDVISSPEDRPEVADQLQATIVWMHSEPMLRGRSYLLRIGPRIVTGTVSPLKYKLDVDSLEHLAATSLALNEIGVCNIELSQAIAFDPYATNRDTGGFILIDRLTNETVGAGLIQYALRRSHNVRWQTLTVDAGARARSMQQTPCVLWFTGLSGAGKSTIADRVETELHRRGHHTYMLDGDNVRHGLNRDLGFTDADRVENIRRVSEVARLMVDAGLIVLVSFISPFRSEREMARALFDAGQFLEVFVDTPLHVAEERDPKGLYRKARRGELTNFTGIDSPYEPPELPDVQLDTTRLSAQDASREVVRCLEARRLVTPLT